MGELHRLTFFNLGNADCCRIDLHCGRKMLFDYADMRDGGNDNDLRADLPAELKEDLGKRDYYDVVAFTHLDRDHINGSTEFFWLQHAEKYQGKGRIKINELWVPAAAITEEGCEDEAKIIRAEARYRLKQRKGIRVFSRPDRLKDWLKENGLEIDDVKHLITDAGQVVPGWTEEQHGVEFFVHSPFAHRMNETEVEDRNQDSIVVQATFLANGSETKVILTDDTTWERWDDIVDITKSKKREQKLEWDVIKAAHHCSYTALGPEKGKDRTEPSKQVRWLYEAQGQRGGIIVSTSEPIPEKGTEADKQQDPPHRQAANYYRDRRDALDGEFIVTMEHPSRSAPKPLLIEIGGNKATVKKTSIGGAASVISQAAPRAGRTWPPNI